jgi:hypothetical protein
VTTRNVIEYTTPIDLVNDTVLFMTAGVTFLAIRIIGDSWVATMELNIDGQERWGRAYFVEAETDYTGRVVSGVLGLGDGSTRYLVVDALAPATEMDPWVGAAILDPDVDIR